MMFLTGDRCDHESNERDDPGYRRRQTHKEYLLEQFQSRWEMGQAETLRRFSRLVRFLVLKRSQTMEDSLDVRSCFFGVEDFFKSGIKIFFFYDINWVKMIILD